MAYTNEWSNIVPAGSEQAATADDHMRRIRLDVSERMETIANWTEDPITLKDEAIPFNAVKQMIIHGCAFQVLDDGTGANYGDSGLDPVSNTAEPLRAPLILPTGVTVSSIEWLVNNGDAAELSLEVISIAFDLSLSQTVHSTLTVTSSGIGIQIQTTDFVITEGRAYFLKADKGGGASFGLHAVRVNYIPNSALETL